jgi:hypothetical protein
MLKEKARGTKRPLLEILLPKKLLLKKPVMTPPDHSPVLPGSRLLDPMNEPEPSWKKKQRQKITERGPFPLPVGAELAPASGVSGWARCPGSRCLASYAYSFGEKR